MATAKPPTGRVRTLLRLPCGGDVDDKVLDEARSAVRCSKGCEHTLDQIDGWTDDGRTKWVSVLACGGRVVDADVPEGVSTFTCSKGCSHTPEDLKDPQVESWVRTFLFLWYVRWPGLGLAAWCGYSWYRDRGDPAWLLLAAFTAAPFLLFTGLRLAGKSTK